jgi:hypothetical protein
VCSLRSLLSISFRSAQFPRFASLHSATLPSLACRPQRPQLWRDVIRWRQSRISIWDFCPPPQRGVGGSQKCLPSELLQQSQEKFSSKVFQSKKIMVGFCGSRSLSAKFQPLVSGVAVQVAKRLAVGVGCASGADAFVREAVPSACVFHASGFGVGRGSFARRSASLVSAVAASPSPRGFVGFVASACPVGLVPSPLAAKCFAGFGSGSWASLALAAGLGVPVFVFWCGQGSPQLPQWSGSWHQVTCRLFSGSWLFLPSQQSIF